MKADILTQFILPISLFIIMLGMGLSLKFSDFLGVFKSPKAFLIGLMCQLCLLPALGLLIVALFDMKGALAVGLMILTFCPGGSTSNMISYLSKGDVALSISLTAIVSIITPFSIPILTALTLNHFVSQIKPFDLPIIKTIIQLLVITIIPVGIGMLLHRLTPTWAKKANKPVKLISVLILFLIIAGIVLKNKNSMASFFLQSGLATLTLNLLAMTLGFAIGRLSNVTDGQAITLGIEVGIQNGTIALLITSTLLNDAVMSIPAVTYSLLMFVTGALFGWLVNKRAILKET